MAALDVLLGHSIIPHEIPMMIVRLASKALVKYLYLRGQRLMSRIQRRNRL